VLDLGFRHVHDRFGGVRDEKSDLERLEEWNFFLVRMGAIEFEFEALDFQHLDDDVPLFERLPLPHF
jgi:hypothetical protein